MREQALLEKIAQAYRQILGRKLTGIYVHGSIAFGCFRWEKSDIDFLVVVEERLTQQEKEGLIRTLLEFDASAPPKGFEMSVMLRSACAPFQDPTPYELHYSNAYRENYQQDLTGTCQMMQGDDPDLAAHVTVVNSVGITLCGVPREQVFAPVPRASYLHSIWFDIENAPEEICRNPVYYILNLCRVLAFTEEGLVLSKEEGGEWGMAHLPEWNGVIRAALSAYRGCGEAPCGESLYSFAETVLALIGQNAVFPLLCPEND